jgi:putative tryptophan/tyrosine transport system substrate-binding protein
VNADGDVVDLTMVTDNMELVRSNVASLLEKSDIVVAVGGRVIPILKQMTRSVPIVIAETVDPVGTGMVASLAHPGENITGFSMTYCGSHGRAGLRVTDDMRYRRARRIGFIPA